MTKQYETDFTPKPKEKKKINAKPIVIGLVAFLVGLAFTNTYYQNAIDDAEGLAGRSDEDVREEVREGLVAEIFARTERQLTINDFPEECQPVLQKQVDGGTPTPEEEFVMGHCNTWFSGFNQGKTMVRADL
jgi:hypothetical protein|tara:strand:- start:1081 stop:1476 length:396 start_codon:yes stop_codon:yes gene_type:complete